MGHVLAENRHGLIVTVQATEPSGTAERTAAINMLLDLHATHGVKPVTLGAGQGLRRRRVLRVLEWMGWNRTCRW
ncbi:MAG: hypothetical protein U0840_11710 [Gemmataceae bacterium]